MKMLSLVQVMVLVQVLLVWRCCCGQGPFNRKVWTFWRDQISPDDHIMQAYSHNRLKYLNGSW